MDLLIRVWAGPSRVARAALLSAGAALLLSAAPVPAADAPPTANAGAKATTGKVVEPAVGQGAGSGPAVQIESRPNEEATESEDTGKRGKRSHVYRIENDPDFQNFSHVMRTAPWVVGLIFLVVGSIFLTPVILLIGIVWYKLRKTRLQNEAWLKLAEKGVVAPSQAAEGVASGLPPPETQSGQAASAATGPSIVQQAVATRRRAVWSDLRKGVVMITIGLALCLYSLVDEGGANWIGLVLLFLGIGYIVLWWLEDRRLAERNSGSGAS